MLTQDQLRAALYARDWDRHPNGDEYDPAPGPRNEALYQAGKEILQRVSLHEARERTTVPYTLDGTRPPGVPAEAVAWAFFPQGHIATAQAYSLVWATPR